MPANVEVKARVGNLAELQNRLCDLAGPPSATLSQKDVFFAVPRGRLKRRDEDDSPTEFIYYQRPDSAEPSISAYFRQEPDDPAKMDTELRRLFGLKAIVQKRRTLFFLDGARVHLDDVDGLGQFVEIEVPISRPSETHRSKALALRLVDRIGLHREDFVADAYDDLVAIH